MRRFALAILAFLSGAAAEEALAGSPTPDAKTRLDALRFHVLDTNGISFDFETELPAGVCFRITDAAACPTPVGKVTGRVEMLRREGWIAVRAEHVAGHRWESYAERDGDGFIKFYDPALQTWTWSRWNPHEDEAALNQFGWGLPDLRIETPEQLSRLVDALRKADALNARRQGGLNRGLAWLVSARLFRAERFTGLGEETIAGVRCEGVSFRFGSTEWRVWFTPGVTPRPCRLTIGSAAPITVTRWEASRSIPEAAFGFRVEPGSRQSVTPRWAPLYPW